MYRMECSEKFSTIRYIENDQKHIEETVVTEFPLTVILNDRELVTLLCSPARLNYLTVGFLASEHFITTKDDIQDLRIDEGQGVAYVTIAGNQNSLEEQELT